MKFVISTHSVVDLITNSSSELFVCNSDKTEETAKEVLLELARLYNEKQKLKPERERYYINREFLFDTVCSVRIADHNYDGDYYDGSYKKGDLIIESCDENSIPWNLMEDIQTIFNAKRYHLG